MLIILLAPSCFDYLKEFYPLDQSQFSLFSRYRRFGDSFAKIARTVQQGNYDIIAISSLFSGYHDDVADLMGHLRESSKARLICGGWAVKGEAAALAGQTRADYLVTGDEEAFVALIGALKRGEDTAALPDVWPRGGCAGAWAPCQSPPQKPFFVRGFPRRMEPSRMGGEPMASLTLNRGFQLKCAFCAIHRTQPYLRRSLEHVSEEFDLLRQSGIKIVNFEDDHLFADRAASEAFLTMLAGHHAKGLKFMAMNGITAPRLAPFATAALDAGFIEFNLSLVISQAEVASRIDRPVFLPAIESIAAAALGRSAVVVFIILGLPDPTAQSALVDILKLAALPVTIGVSPLYLLPAIPLFAAMGLPEARQLMRGSALYRFSPGFSQLQVVALWKFTRMLGAIKCSCALEEHLHYFALSLEKGLWHRLDQGAWTPYLENPLRLPESIPVTTLDGSSVVWHPSRGEIRSL